MPSKSDKDRELSPAEEPTDQDEESTDAAPSGVGRVWNAVSRAAGATASGAGKAADATTSAAGQAAGATASAVGKAADATTSAAGQAAGATTSAVSRAADATTSAAGATAAAAGNTLDAVASAPKVAFGKIFPECPVPAFMLPTGPGPEDYVILFRFEELIEKLRSGVRVRPKLELWAARDKGYDLEHLAREIKEDFVSQFEEFREALIRDRLIPIEKLTIEQERLGNQIKNDFIGLAAGSAFMMLSAAPVLLLGLWIGWRPKIKLLSLLKEYMYVRGERDQFVEQFNSEIKKLNSEMDSKNKALLRAVKRLEVKVHPRIQEIARLICEAERVEFSASDPESENIPDVEPYLRHTAYLERLPQKHIRFLG